MNWKDPIGLFFIIAAFALVAWDFYLFNKSEKWPPKEDKNGKINRR